MGKIDFEAKTDRELLLLTAQQSNETVSHLKKINSTLEKHETRITTLETKKNRVNWQMMSVLIVIAGGVVYGLCHFFGG